MVPAAKYQKLAKVYAEVKAPVNAAVRSSTHHTLLCREAPGCSSWDSFGPLRLTAHFDIHDPPQRPPSCSSSRRTRCSRVRCRISQARTTSCRPSSVRSRAAANRLRCRSAPPQPVLASYPPRAPPFDALQHAQYHARACAAAYRRFHNTRSTRTQPSPFLFPPFDVKRHNRGCCASVSSSCGQ